MKYGNIKWFNTKKGYGLIPPLDDKKDVFVHITQLEKIGISSISSGHPVSFNTYLDRGRTAANNIILL